jgi:hypothetical protein
MPRCLARNFLALSLVFAAIGCSGSSGPRITGKVMLDGAPLADAEVLFEKREKEGGSNSGAKTNADGKLQVVTMGKPVVAGTYLVAVSKYVDKKGKVLDPGEIQQLRMAGLAKNIVPDKFTNPMTSDLKVELKQGDFEIPPFDLKSKGK